MQSVAKLRGTDLRCFTKQTLRRPKRQVKVRFVARAPDKKLGERFLKAVENIPDDKRMGEPPAEVKAILDEIHDQAQSQGYFPVVTQGGSFRQLINTTKLATTGTTMSLGTMSFKQFGPQDLMIELAKDVGGFHYKSNPPDAEYVAANGFQVLDEQHKGLRGVCAVCGKYSVNAEKPWRQDIKFDTLKLELHDKDRLQEWLDLTRSENSMMGLDGVAVIQLPQALPGWRDFIYVDDDIGLQITIANRGAYEAFVRK